MHMLLIRSKSLSLVGRLDIRSMTYAGGREKEEEESFSSFVALLDLSDDVVVGSKKNETESADDDLQVPTCG